MSRQVFARVYRPQMFTQNVVLSDGSTYAKLTTSPRHSVRLTKDIRNAPLWNPDAGKSLNQEENGRLARFKGRFAGYAGDETRTETASASASAAGGQERDDMDWMVSAGARAAPKMSDRELRESTRKKGVKGAKK